MRAPVLLCGSEWFPNSAGGLSRYFYELVHCVARSEILARAVVTYLRDGQSGPVPLSAMAPEGAGLLRRLHGARKQVLAALHEGADIVNAHFALYARPWVKRLGTVSLVVNFHGPWASEMLAEDTGLATRLKATVARGMERVVYRRATRCITLSRFFASLLERDYGVEPDRITVIPGGADLLRFLRAPDRIEARRALGWPEEVPIVLTVRRLHRRMGLEMLINAASLVRHMYGNFRLFIAGSGPIAGELRRTIYASGATDYVRLLGFIPEEDLPLVYAAADLSVMPSVTLEGFGLSIAESLAAGTPVVCTPVGGMPEVIGPLDPALITSEVSAEALAKLLAAAINGQKALPDTETCREYAMRYDWNHVFPEILKVWREAGARL